jgi:hypothetical protein
MKEFQECTSVEEKKIELLMHVFTKKVVDG